jgi:hypothetical protein
MHTNNENNKRLNSTWMFFELVDLEKKSFRGKEEELAVLIVRKGAFICMKYGHTYK